MADSNDSTKPPSPALRFLRAAGACRVRDLQQLSVLGDLVRGISELIHALQRERGASTIFFGSQGQRFADKLQARVVDSVAAEAQVRSRLEHIDERLDQMRCGARFYLRIARAIQALDVLPLWRAQVTGLKSAPKDIVNGFTDIIAALLSVGFEAADIAADPATSRALVALVNFAQGKEYAGQERAIGGGAFSSATLQEADRTQLCRLAGAQQRAFDMFADFAQADHVAAFEALDAREEAAQLKRMRAALQSSVGGEGAHRVIADEWYEVTTARIDAMKEIEGRLAADLGRLCDEKLGEAQAKLHDTNDIGRDQVAPGMPVALFFAAGDDPGLYGVDPALPKPMRSIIDVVEAQSRRIDEMNLQLESARGALAERKVIDRAKGLLMRSRRLSDEEAYTLMRKAAMNQNKRIIEVAEAIVSMEELLKT
jgi:hypothetical protein